MYKSLKQRQQEAIGSLPVNDSQAIEDVKIYSSMSDEALNDLPCFKDNGDIKLYKVGDSYMGKFTLIQFVKQLKNR